MLVAVLPLLAGNAAGAGLVQEKQAPRSLPVQINEAIDRGTSFLLGQQHRDGYS